MAPEPTKSAPEECARLAAMRKEAGFTQVEMAARLGIERDTYAKYERRSPLPKNLLKQVAELLGTDVMTLLTGTPGANLSEGTRRRPPAVAPKRTGLVEVAGHELAMIPVYDLGLSAGHGAWSDEDGDPIYLQPYRHQWLRALTNAPLESLFVARVSGDSMEPTLHNGDQVLVDRSRNHASKDGIYALRWQDDILVKRISVDPRNGILTVASDNARYQTYKNVKPDSVSILGRVIWLGRGV